jgi:hypothetical protein
MAVTSGGWRRSRRPMSPRRILRKMRNPAMLRLMFGILLALLILRVLTAFYGFRLDSSGYGGVGLGNSRQDILYGIGRPIETADGSGKWRPLRSTSELSSDSWAYDSGGGGRIEVRFNPKDHRADVVSCTQPDAIESACGRLYGITLGASEDRLSFKLGKPTSERLIGGIKVARYDDLGVEFTLKQYVIYKIEARRARGGSLARYLRFVRSLVP